MYKATFQYYQSKQGLCKNWQTLVAIFHAAMHEIALSHSYLDTLVGSAGHCPQNVGSAPVLPTLRNCKWHVPPLQAVMK